MKVGILTFHYSNNYGGLLQCYALQKTIQQLGYDVEIINYVPSNYSPYSVFDTMTVIKSIIKRSFNGRLQNINIKKEYTKTTTEKFINFRKRNMYLSKELNETEILDNLDKYDAIIVGSDQVWNPSQRSRNEYFLDFGSKYKGKKISYAADSTTENIDSQHKDKLVKCLSDFDNISVRNKHSKNFVQSLVGDSKYIVTVADPSLLYDYTSIEFEKSNDEEYIVTYILGKEIDGGHDKVISKIKSKYGNIPVYGMVMSNMDLKLYNYADKMFYDLGPDEWVNMIRNAKFVYTDSFHGVMFSMKFKKPFLAYYAEKMRSTRFIDLKDRYNIDKYIIESVDDIEKKGSLDDIPNYDEIDNIISCQVKESLEYIRQSLK